MTGEPSKSITLGELAELLGASLTGDNNKVITGLATLEQAKPDQLTFLSNGFYRKYLTETKAGAVLVSPILAEDCPVDCLILDNPYLAYAKASQFFNAAPKTVPGVHSSAVVSSSATVHDSVVVGPNCVVEDGASIAENCVLGPGVIVGAGSSVGADSWLWGNVTLYHGVTIGKNAIIHSGTVIGSDGFGFAPSPEGWVKIAQLGGVKVGDNVEIGAGTTIDRGALEDTILADGVIIDNQVQIAHNVVIGENTAIAGCTAIAGSTTIGAYCTIAGAVGITGHLYITDNVHITAMTLVSKSIREPGAYSSGTVMAPSTEWKKNAVRFGQLDLLNKRVGTLEKEREEDNKS